MSVQQTERQPVHCPVCGERVREWVETERAIHCFRAGRTWKKHLKEREKR